MKTETYNDETKEFSVYSSITGERLLTLTMKNRNNRKQIVRAIHMAENIGFNSAKIKIRDTLDNSNNF